MRSRAAVSPGSHLHHVKPLARHTGGRPVGHGVAIRARGLVSASLQPSSVGRSAGPSCVRTVTCAPHYAPRPVVAWCTLSVRTGRLRVTAVHRSPAPVTRQVHGPQRTHRGAPFWPTTVVPTSYAAGRTPRAAGCETHRETSTAQRRWKDPPFLDLRPFSIHVWTAPMRSPASRPAQESRQGCTTSACNPSAPVIRPTSRSCSPVAEARPMCARRARRAPPATGDARRRAPGG